MLFKTNSTTVYFFQVATYFSEHLFFMIMKWHRRLFFPQRKIIHQILGFWENYFFVKKINISLCVCFWSVSNTATLFSQIWHSLEVYFFDLLLIQFKCLLFVLNRKVSRNVRPHTSFWAFFSFMKLVGFSFKWLNHKLFSPCSFEQNQVARNHN